MQLGSVFRKMLERPRNGLLVILAAALGIGLPATMFAVVYGLFLRPLPFDEGARIVQLGSSQPAAGMKRIPLSIVEYETIAEIQRSFDALSAWYGFSVIVSGPEAPAEHLNGAFVDRDFFEVLGVRPALGPGFPGESAQESVALISHRMWRERYGRDPKVLSRVIHINGDATRVVGVMPEGFRFPLSQEVWLPMSLTAADRTSRRTPLQGVAKLAEGVSLERAQQELDRVSANVAAAHPATHEGIVLQVKPYIDAYSDGEMRDYLTKMLAAVFGVFLVACANIANLMASRGAGRAQELAIRQALGARQSSIIWLLLVETLLLSLIGGLLGLLLAAVASRRLQEAVQPFLRSFWIDIRLDATVGFFGLGLTLLIGVIAGIAPALAVSRKAPIRALRAQSSGMGLPGRRVAAALVVAQIALSCGLLVATGMLIASVTRLEKIDLGFGTSDLVTALISLPRSEYPEPAKWAQFFNQLETRLESVPEIEEIALTSTIPIGSMRTQPIEVEGVVHSPEGGPQAAWVAISPSFFDVFGVEIQAGRRLLATDDEGGARVVVIDRALAEKLFAGQDALGRQVRFAGEESWSTVVGIVADTFRQNLPTRQRGFLPPFQSDAEARTRGTVYRPLVQNPLRSQTVAIRSRGAQGELIAKIREQVASLDNDIPTMRIQSFEEGLARLYWDYRLMSRLFTAFGMATLLLAMIGLYGVMGLTVAQRWRELGMRVALGARPGSVLRLVLQAGMAKILIGLVAGLVLGFFLARSMSALLYNVAPWDPEVFLMTAVGLSVAGILACVVPVLKAVRVDPMDALRLE